MIRGDGLLHLQTVETIAKRNYVNNTSQPKHEKYFHFIVANSQIHITECYCFLHMQIKIEQGT